MFARVTTLRVQTGKLDELIRVFQDAIAPTLALQPGCGGITLMSDARSGRAIVLELWAGGVLPGDRVDHGGMLANGLLAEAPQQEVYEVSVQVEMTEEGAAHIRGI